MSKRTAEDLENTGQEGVGGGLHACRTEDTPATILSPHLPPLACLRQHHAKQVAGTPRSTDGS